MPWGIAAAAVSVVGAISSADAAKDAAHEQSQSAERSIEEQRRQFDLNRQDLAPFMQTGVAGNKQLAYLLGLGGSQGGYGANYGSGSASPAAGAGPSTGNGTESEISNWYRNVLGRDPDQGGLKYWEDQVANNGADAAYKGFLYGGRTNEPQNFKELNRADASTPIRGAPSEVGNSVVDDWARNVFGRSATQEELRKYGSSTLETAQQDYADFVAAGKAAGGQAKEMTRLQASIAAPDPNAGSLLRKFSESDLQADPVYKSGLKFGLDQGTEGINARAIAGGGYDSGATLKALTRYANDYGSTKANESYNRFNIDNNSVYNKLAGVSGAGQQATSQAVSNGTSIAANIGSSLTDAGSARSAGIVGGANAWGEGLAGVGKALNSYGTNSWLKGLSGGSTDYGGSSNGVNTYTDYGAY